MKKWLIAVTDTESRDHFRAMFLGIVVFTIILMFTLYLSELEQRIDMLECEIYATQGFNDSLVLCVGGEIKSNVA